MIWKKPWKKRTVALLVGGCALIVGTNVYADIGSEVWQKNYTPNASYHQGFLYSVGFNTDGSILANGLRSEADSGTAIGLRYDASNGNVSDSGPEWFFFEYTWGDYAHDRFYDQHIDSSGNIYFVGSSYPNGFNSSSARYQVPNIWRFDSTYDNPVAGNPDRPVWRKYHYDAGVVANNGEFQAMAVDRADNIIAVGWFNNLVSSTSNRDWIIDKYDSDGTRAEGFPKSFNKDDLHDYAYDVATDSQNNFIVVGAILIDATTDHYDWLVRKYQSDGTLIWEASYDLAGGNDMAYSVVVDSNDNIIVGGYRTNVIPVVESDWYFVKYAKDADVNGDAVVLWEQFWDDGNSKHGFARAMVLDDRDNFYIIGSQQKDSIAPAYSDMYRSLLQYRDGQSGSLLKSQGFEFSATPNNVPALEHDYPRTLALDGNQLVIAGYTQDGIWSTDYGKTGRILMLDIQQIYNVSTDAFDTDCSDGECSLQAALTAAALNNGINVELHLQEGTYTGNFIYDPGTGNNGDLTVLGGYSADFSSRTLDPTNTVLDGNDTGRVLQLNYGIVTGATAVNGSILVEGVTVTNGNSASGAGIFALTSSPGIIEISNNIIENNLATENGGGCAIAVSDFVSPSGGNIRFSDNIVRNNRVWLDGATEGYGAGCSVLVTGTTVITNNLVYSNWVGDDVTYTSSAGGGLLFDLMAGELSLTNNTITENQVDDSGNVRAGAGVLLSTNLNSWNSVTVEINNTIAYNNYGDDIYNRVISETGGVTEGSTLTISHSIYDPNNYTKSSDVGTVEPTFVNNVTNSQPWLSLNAGTLYHLVSEVSPCIDSGNNAADNMPDIDLAGEIRPQDGDNDATATANMGCYESGFAFRVVTSTSANGSHPAPQIVDPGDTPSFTFEADLTYHIASISGCGINYTNTDNSVISREVTTHAIALNCTIDATYAINQYTLTASADVNGSLDASTPSPQTVDHGATTTFTFNADAGYHVATIIGCGVDVSNTDNSITSRSVTTSGATAACNVNATFAPHHTVTASADVHGSLDLLTPSPKTVNEGDTTQFTFNADSGYHVASINGCGISYTNTSNAVSTRTEDTTGITADCPVSATFAINQYQVTASAGARGFLDVSTPSPQTVDHESTATFTFSADTGYHVASISDCGISYTNTSNAVSTRTESTTAITADCSVSATFAINQYQVTASAGVNGSRDVSTPSPQMVDYKSTATFTFNADTGYHVASISGCGISYSNTDMAITSATETTGSITAECPVSATFVVNTYTVSSSVDGGHGAIDPAGDQTVDHGEIRQFDLISEAGYHPDQVTGTCGGILSGNSFTSNAVTTGCTVIASFTDQYTLSVLFGGNGSGTVTSNPVGIDDCTTDCSAGFLDGTSVTLSAVVADKKSVFVGWSGDVDAACSGSDDCIVTMDQAREITATFISGFPWNMFLPAIINIK